MLLQALNITTHEDALLCDDTIGALYNKNIIKDIIKDIVIGIANGQFSPLPELFELDSFFNEYAHELKQVEIHISGLKMFDKMDTNKLHQSIVACPDIAGLQSCVAEILAKNAYLMTQEINIYDVIKDVDIDKAKAFYENMNEIEKGIEYKIQGIYHQVTEETKIETVPVKKKKMYVLDTCALIHNPDLLLYFTDEEYVRIPTKVIDELGKIKDKRNHKYDAILSDTARILARNIETSYLKLFNPKTHFIMLIE